MGRSRLLHRGLIPLLLLAACGDDEDLLQPEDISYIYSGGGGGGGYGPDASGGAPGRIVGKVRFQGSPWASKKLDTTTPDGFCTAGHEPHGLMSEWFVLGADGAIANAVVYIKEGAPGNSEPPKDPVVIDQIKCQYVPHVSVLRLGQPLVVKSSDAILHNVHMVGPAVPGNELNISMSRPGQLDPIYLRRPEMALRVWCEVHGWMEAWVAVVAHPFHDITGEDGSFAIENVPPGTYRLAAWQERIGEKPDKYQDVTVTAGGTATVEFVLER